MHGTLFGRALVRGALLTVLLTGLLFVPQAPAWAEPFQPAQSTQPQLAPGARPQQVVALDSAGRIRVYGLIGGQFVLIWISPSTTGWTNFALGDFDADYQKEIVATSSHPGEIDRMQVLHPAPGANPIDFNRNLGSGSTYHLLATGHFKNVPGEQIISSYYFVGANGVFYEVLDDWTPQSGGRFWPKDATVVTFYNAPLHTMVSGDASGDGLADLVIGRNSSFDHLIQIWNWQSSYWAQLFSQAPGLNEWPTWNAFAVGRVVTSNTGNQVVSALGQPAGNPNVSEIVMQLTSDNKLLPVGPVNANFRHTPGFGEMTLANINGNTAGIKQIVGIRDPGNATDFGLVMLDAVSGQTTFGLRGDYGTNSWRRVAAGDVDADGRDEVAVVRPDVIRVFYQPETSGAALDIPAPGDGVTWLSALAIGDTGVDFVPLVDPGFTVTPTTLNFMMELGGTRPQSTISVNRAIPNGAPIHWVAIAMNTQSLPQALAALANGSAQVTASGLVSNLPELSVPAWLQFTPDQGTTGTTMTVGVRSDWTATAGHYPAVILFVPDQPFNPDWIRTTQVTLNVGRLTYMPMVRR